MNIVATIQARMNSSRLPGKVMANIAGAPVLEWQLRRLSSSLLLDEVVVATTTNPCDDPIVSLCDRLGVKSFRGKEDDVLERVADLIVAHNVHVHVELFGDSPLIDASLVDQMVGCFLKHKNEFDFVTNAYDCGFPAGFDINVYFGERLISAHKELSTDDPNREHVGFNIRNKSSPKRVKRILAPPHLHAPNLFVELDVKEDLFVIQKIFDHFLKLGMPDFSSSLLVQYLISNPKISSHNSSVERRWSKKHNETMAFDREIS